MVSNNCGFIEMHKSTSKLVHLFPISFVSNDCGPIEVHKINKLGSIFPYHLCSLVITYSFKSGYFVPLGYNISLFTVLIHVKFIN